MQISNVYDSKHIYMERRSNNGNQRKASSPNAAPRDTVSFSKKALTLHKATQKGKGAFSLVHETSEKELEMRLTSWFQNMTSTPVNGTSEAYQSGGILLPENKKLAKELEAKIDAIHGERNAFMRTPQKILDAMKPYQQKLNAIHALGDKTIMTDDVLEKATTILDKLEAKWKETQKNDPSSPHTQLQALLNRASKISFSQMSEEEKMRKLKEDMLEKMAQEQSRSEQP